MARAIAWSSSPFGVIGTLGRRWRLGHADCPVPQPAKPSCRRIAPSGVYNDSQRAMVRGKRCTWSTDAKWSLSQASHFRRLSKSGARSFTTRRGAASIGSCGSLPVVLLSAALES